MTSLMRHAPFDDRFDSLMRVFLRPVAERADPAVQIKIDVEENEKAYLVDAEIPGVDKDHIDVTIEGNQVTITAKVKREREVKEGSRVLRAERLTGKAYRSFALAQEVDEAAAEASYVNGVLRLTLPKKAAQNARKVEIH